MILNAYSKVPQKSKVSSTKSEFEELEAVPTMAVVDGPLEPPSSAVSNVADAPEDLSFVNFFSAAMTIGNTPNLLQLLGNLTTLLRRCLHHLCQLLLLLPLCQPCTYPLFQHLHLYCPQRGTAEPGSNSNRTTNLVKPSSFFVYPPSSAVMITSVPSSTPTAPPLHHAASVQRPYGAPLLQPFPHPTPPPSFTLASPNYGPVITREKVRDALLVLVQDNEFIDMVYRALLDSHQS